MIKRYCEFCNKGFMTPIYPTKIGYGRFCSVKCSKKKISDETRRKMSESAIKVDYGKWLRGVQKSSEHKLKLKLCQIGKHNSPKTEFKKGHKTWDKGIKRPELSGSNNSHWKGGVTPIHEKIRKSVEYKIWRDSVFNRDNYMCKMCGISGSKKILHADHIKQFAYFPELRFDINNGRTLCIDCHRKTETWGLNMPHSPISDNDRWQWS